MTTRLIFSKPAQADATFIVSDLAQKAGLRCASEYAAAFDRLYLRLLKFPQSGAPRPALGNDVRIAVVRPYLVIYEYMVADDAVMILRLVQGRRRITRNLLRSK
ncbi:type II toxin-antitoxin system RelE/ParE family toxin [Methylocystis bryophila]|uniref:Plasmid stabilization protein n=1 Tax=Methylocystis bryophila TaxID=655015 RepID=A0A1W6MYS9_9HYPH|nr:type II toxin-antitoxin system RelE/ParE family toxin [Methylocystis bryophila]ARN82750.1 hypothetical protein B1812_18490 [Methylocystis bryophila]BDV38987.1 hypothetical protein DSM21852_22400 [Methylocystis bryophila]